MDVIGSYISFALMGQIWTFTFSSYICWT